MSFTAEVLSAGMFGYMKPRVEFFEAIEERCNGFEKGDYLIIDDSLKADVGFGMNAGIDSCWFNRDGDVLDANYSPTYIISALKELTNFL